MNVDILYIALDREIDRISFMDNWLSKCECNYDRVQGVEIANHGAELRYDRATRLKTFGYDLTASEVGCFLAHRKCWVHAKTTDRLTMIMESDLCPVVEESFSKLIDSIDAARDEFDLLRLHGIFENNELFVRRKARMDESLGLYLCQTLGDPMGAGAYVVTPAAANRLLEESCSFYEPVDVFLGSTWKHRLRYRTLKPYPFKAMKFESVIGERRRPKQSLISRLMIEMARAQNDMRRILYMPWHFFR